jgi:hypothetical protein
MGQRALALLRDDLAGYMALAPCHSAAAHDAFTSGTPRASPTPSWSFAVECMVGTEGTALLSSSLAAPAPSSSFLAELHALCTDMLSNHVLTGFAGTSALHVAAHHALAAGVDELDRQCPWTRDP